MSELPIAPWHVGYEEKPDGIEWYVESSSGRTIAIGIESELVARTIASIPNMIKNISDLERYVESLSNELKEAQDEI
jgi:hypothetical protein